MSYGALLVTSAGQVIDTSKLPATIYETFTVLSNATGSKAYPTLAGFTVYVSVVKFVAQPGGITVATVDYNLGYPRVSWAPSSSGATTAAATIVVVVK
jgi:hypothetical protein